MPASALPTCSCCAGIVTAEKSSWKFGCVTPLPMKARAARAVIDGMLAGLPAPESRAVLESLPAVRDLTRNLAR